MTNTQADIMCIKQTLKKMQNDIDELTQLIEQQEQNHRAHEERMQNISYMNLVPSTQACSSSY